MKTERRAPIEEDGKLEIVWGPGLKTPHSGKKRYKVDSSSIILNYVPPEVSNKSDPSMAKKQTFKNGSNYTPIVSAGSTTFTLSIKDLEDITYYIKTGYLPPDIAHNGSKSQTIMDLASKRYVLKDDVLYYKKHKDGKLYKTIGHDDIEGMNKIIKEMHGPFHMGANEMYNRISSEYFGIPRVFIQSWTSCCLECKNMFNPPISMKRYSEEVSVVREPWFAICIYSIKANEITPGTTGLFVIVQDVYSKYVLYRYFETLNEDLIHDYLLELISLFGIPEIIRFLDTIAMFDSFVEFCNTYDITTISYLTHPEHIGGHIEKLPMNLRSFLTIDALDWAKENNNYSMINSVRKTIFKYNHLEKNDRCISRVYCRIPAEVFFRRTIRVSKKSDPTGSARYIPTKYKIKYNDLPSILDFIPEYCETPKPSTETTDPTDDTPTVLEYSLMHKDTPKDPSTDGDNTTKQMDTNHNNDSKRLVKTTENPKTDKEIEKETRPDPEEYKTITLYNKDDIHNMYAEHNPPEYNITSRPLDTAPHGAIVYVATEESIKTTPIPSYKSQHRNYTIDEIDHLIATNNWPIESINKTEIWYRNINVPTLSFLPHRYWILDDIPGTDNYKLYNIDTKETEIAHKNRIFKGKYSIQKESLHIINFLYHKYSIKTLKEKHAKLYNPKQN
ncbi:hypothetical protein NEOKW01_0384 [Nematocida sp. AWRm80]|nr:hypothetical protein NEOKW01_0384 [Nematocida sp. AWRm80]